MLASLFAFCAVYGYVVQAGYTGYLWEDIKDNPQVGLFDVLVDGEFILEQRNISLPYCGSNNQRVIDVQKSLQQNTVVLWNNSSL